MGRDRTGAVHHFSALRISITDIQKYTGKNIISYNRKMEWNVNGNYSGSINYDASFDENDRYLRLKYTHTDHKDEKHKMDYKVRIEGVPSNLGKGENLYFICPVTYNRCKILYSCYGSKYFMSREAYNHRIFYTSQMYSKRDRINKYYFELENEITVLNQKKRNSHYKGVNTHLQNRIEKLENKALIFDLNRWSFFLNDFQQFKGLI